MARKKTKKYVEIKYVSEREKKFEELKPPKNVCEKFVVIEISTASFLLANVEKFTKLAV